MKVRGMRSLAEIVQLRTSACRDAAHVLPAIAAGEYPGIARDAGAGGVADGGARDARIAHVGQCLRCQAELSAYRRLIAQLGDLRGDLKSPPEGALRTLLEAIAAEPAPSTHWAVRAAYLGGITVATAAAGAAGVLVWMSRRRPGMAQAS
jgi:hypothetical protein